MADGIDVYTAYQTVTDWAKVKAAGYSFVYVKVSDGMTLRATNGYPAAAKKAGLKAGAYHYAQLGDPVAQADYFISRCVREGALDLAPALDLEDPFVPGTAAASFAVAFLRRVQAQGHRPCLYANNSMMAAVLPTVRAAVPSVLVWVARYGATPTVAYDVWQHRRDGQVPGISASGVDLNRGIVPLNTGQENNVATLDNDDLLNIYSAVWFGRPGGKLIADRLANAPAAWPETHLGSLRDRIVRQELEPMQTELTSLTADLAEVKSTVADVKAALANTSSGGQVAIDYDALAAALLNAGLPKAIADETDRRSRDGDPTTGPVT